MTSMKARPCDSCVRRRARWYCATDDAFLCHGCDTSVHSANLLVRCHHRLQLRSTPNPLKSPEGDSCPAWLRGFMRKARTPRPHNKTVSSVVPELETSEENNNEEEEQQLLYRVPVYDLVLDEYCEPAPTEENSLAVQLADYNCNSKSSSSGSSTSSGDSLVGFLPSDMELAEFSADMESFLGRGLKNDSFSMEELGLGDANCGLGDDEQLVKEELNDNLADAGNVELYRDMYLSRETLDINLDDCRPAMMMEEEDELEGTKTEIPADEYRQRKKVGLRLDYEAIITEWSVQGPSTSPWMNGERPQFGPDDCWLDYMGMWGGGDQQVKVLVQAEVGGGNIDEGREARVSRYREKRRTRLFSKKIRYEVRKLNAEKRPRMKGRFVKRAYFAAATPY